MTRFLALTALFGLAVALSGTFADEKGDKKPEARKEGSKEGDKKPEARKDGEKPAMHIGHMVYFKLKESNAANRKKLVAACNKYLNDHEGTVYYSAGVLAEAFNREVNDREWDVALHLVFRSKAAHDKYQDHPRHLKFIEENKETWGKVRVFDAEVEPMAKREGDKKKS